MRARNFPVELCVLLAVASTPTLATSGIATIPLAQPLALVTLNQTMTSLNIPAYWVSEKLDGVRAIWDGITLRFKSGNAIAAPAWFTAHFPPQPMVGELWLGRGQFEHLSGIVRRHTPNDTDWQLVSFNVFDFPSHPGQFSERLTALEAQLQALAIPWLQAVKQEKFKDAAALRQHFLHIVAHGGEGLMLHKTDGLWVNNQPPHLLKLKLQEDAEATIIGYQPGKGRLKGQTGALIVRLENGQVMHLGSGLSDALRQNPPPMGSIVTYRHRGTTRNGLPRFASYWRIREEE